MNFNPFKEFFQNCTLTAVTLTFAERQRFLLRIVNQPFFVSKKSVYVEQIKKMVINHLKLISFNINSNF